MTTIVNHICELRIKIRSEILEVRACVSVCERVCMCVRVRVRVRAGRGVE